MGSQPRQQITRTGALGHSVATKGIDRNDGNLVAVSGCMQTVSKSHRKAAKSANRRSYIAILTDVSSTLIGRDETTMRSRRRTWSHFEDVRSTPMCSHSRWVRAY